MNMGLLSVAVFVLLWTSCCYGKSTRVALLVASVSELKGYQQNDVRCANFDITVCTEECFLGFQRDAKGCIVSCQCKASGLFDGDIIMTAEEARTHFDPNFRAASRKLKRWNNIKGTGGTFVIPYTLHRSVRQNMHKTRIILSALRNFEEKTCLRFRSRSKEIDHIEFTNGNKCASNYGRVGGKQEIYIGNGCDKEQGTIMHEIMHALGFFHEHSRPDRDRYVKIQLENVLLGDRFNFNKLSGRVIDSMGSPYDYQSVMHYGGYSFSKNEQPTIIDRRSNTPAVAQRKGFSSEDIKQINSMYKCRNYRFNWYYK